MRAKKGENPIRKNEIKVKKLLTGQKLSAIILERLGVAPDIFLNSSVGSAYGYLNTRKLPLKIKEKLVCFYLEN